MAAVSQPRRRFIRLCFALIAGFGLWKYLAAGPKRKTAVLEVAEQDLPHEGALVYADQKLALVRRAGDLYALSLICTHLGCTVQVHPEDISCPCHGSRFDLSGQVLNGPATRALERLPLRRQGKIIEVNLPEPS